MSQHKEVIAKEGLGFDPNTIRAKNVALKKSATPQNVVFVCEVHKGKGKNKFGDVVGSESATKGKSIPNKSKEAMHPSHVLSKAKDGDVYAKFVEPHNAF